MKPAGWNASDGSSSGSKASSPRPTLSVPPFGEDAGCNEQTLAVRFRCSRSYRAAVGAPARSLTTNSVKSFGRLAGILLSYRERDAIHAALCHRGATDDPAVPF